MVYYELVEDLLNMTILDVSDLKRKFILLIPINSGINFGPYKIIMVSLFRYIYLDMENVVHLKFNKYDDFYLAFDTYERKYNFLKLLKLASELAVQS